MGCRIDRGAALPEACRVIAPARELAHGRALRRFPLFLPERLAATQEPVLAHLVEVLPRRAVGGGRAAKADLAPANAPATAGHDAQPDDPRVGRGVDLGADLRGEVAFGGRGFARLG